MVKLQITGLITGQRLLSVVRSKCQALCPQDTRSGFRSPHSCQPDESRENSNKAQSLATGHPHGGYFAQAGPVIPMSEAVFPRG